MFSSSQLASMRACQTAALPSVCDIQRKTKVSDGMGGELENYATVATGVPCRVESEFYQPAQNQAAEQRRTITNYPILLPFDTDIRVDDYLLVGAFRYRVCDANTGSSEALVVTALCERIT